MITYASGGINGGLETAVTLGSTVRRPNSGTLLIRTGLRVEVWASGRHGEVALCWE